MMIQNHAHKADAEGADTMSLPQADLSAAIAAVTCQTRYADLGPDAQLRACQSILDTLGVIVAASTLSPDVAPVAALCAEMGGRAEASILGFGGPKMPALHAAFVNGAMAHCLDFDDHAPEGHHPSSSIVPVVFAFAERAAAAGRPVSGREIVTATAIGQDLFLRLRRNVVWQQDWHLTTIIGVFSATVAGARVLGLDTEQVVSALGIAAAQASGTMELAYGIGSDLRGMYAGFIAKQACLSVLLAERGVKGPNSAFEGKAGFFATYLGNRYDRDAILQGFGREFTGKDLLYKAWPSCGLTHSYIHATASLMREADLDPSDIREIRVHVGDFQERLCLPLAARRAPKVAVDAKFSIPYCVAVAALHGTVGLADFTASALRDPAVLAMAQKVVPVRAEGQDWGAKLPHARIEIATTDGRNLSRIGDMVPGDADAPMDQQYLDAKFAEAMRFSARPCRPEVVAQVNDMVMRLAELPDGAAIMRILEQA